MILDSLPRFGNTCPCKEARLQPLGAGWVSCVLVCRLPLPLKDVNSGNTDLDVPAEKGGWEESSSGLWRIFKMSACTYVSMYVLLGNVHVHSCAFCVCTPGKCVFMNVLLGNVCTNVSVCTYS